MKNFKSIILATGVAIAMLSACETNKQPVLTASNLDPAKFDTVINGDTVKLFVLKNANGMEVCITNLGGRVVSIMVPDRNGEMKDVVETDQINPEEIMEDYEEIAVVSEEPEEEEIEYDEHVWLSLKNAVLFVNKISSSLSSISMIRVTVLFWTDLKQKALKHRFR